MRRNQVELNDENHAMEKIAEDRKHKKRHLRRQKRRHFIANAIKIGFVAFLIIGLYLFDSSNFSRIQTLKISGNTSISDAQILEALKIEKGDRIFFTHGFIKESRGKKIEGIESIDVNVYYTKGYVSIDVTEIPIVAYQSSPELKVFYADGKSKIIDESQKAILAGLPLLVGFTEETLKPEMLKSLSELDSEVISAISEIHIKPKSYDPLAMKLYMSDKYLVYVSIETLPMMYLYATLLTVAEEGKKCIDFNEYGPSNEDGTASIRACTADEYKN